MIIKQDQSLITNSMQLRDLIAEGGDQFLLCPIANVRRADGVHSPVINLPVRDERPESYARKLVTG